MKKIDFPLWSDTIFFFACSFLVSLCILRYYDLSMWPAALLSAALAFAFAVLVFGLGYLWRRKKFLLKRDLEEKENLMLHLALSSPQTNAQLFLPVFQKDCTDEKTNADTDSNADADDTQHFRFLFTMQPLSADAVAEAIRDCPSGKTLHIVCNALTGEAARLCERFDISVTDGNNAYALLKEKNLLPEKYICGEKKKRGVRERIRFGLRKKNSRSFFFSGAALLVLSLFSFFPLYYIIGGCTLVFASVLVRIFGYA